MEDSLDVVTSDEARKSSLFGSLYLSMTFSQLRRNDIQTKGPVNFFLRFRRNNLSSFF